MRKSTRSVLIASSVAIAVGAAHIGYAYAAPASVRSREKPTTISVKKTNASVPKGQELYEGIFFDVGPYAGKLNEFHDGNKTLSTRRASRVKYDPKHLRELATHLEKNGKRDAAEVARMAASLYEDGSAGTKLSPRESRVKLLAAIKKEDPKFLSRFQEAMTSGNPVEVDRGLADAGMVTVRALKRLQDEGLSLHDIQVGPDQSPVVVAVVVVIAITVVVAANVALVVDVKDTPDDYAPAPNDDDDCSGGGDCPFEVPRTVLRRQQLAKLIAKRFSAA